MQKDDTVLGIWRELHESFRVKKRAGNYLEQEKRNGLPGEEVAKAGFMSPYGGSAVHEDFATIAEGVTMEQKWTAAGEDSPGETGCEVLNAYQGRPFPRRYAALLSKIGLIRAMDLVTEADFRACVSGAWLPPQTAPGIHFLRGDAGMDANVFSQGLVQSVGAQKSQGFYKLLAEGTLGFGKEKLAAKTMLRVITDHAIPVVGTPDVGMPRGLYRLAPSRVVDPRRGYMGVLVPKNKAANVEFDGHVVVYQASLDGVVAAAYPDRACRPDAPMGKVGCIAVEKPPKLILINAPGKSASP
jgi:hypothetical protein